MNLEQAKQAIRTAIGGVGFVDNPEELEEVIKFLDTLEHTEVEPIGECYRVVER